ncbi:MAG: HAMP domain-containing methyl-accepting chemotaxis protein [Armatimonadota bacterium]
MRLNSISVGKRLAIAFIIITAITAIIGWRGAYGMRFIQTQARTLVEIDNAAIQHCLSVNLALTDLSRVERTLTLPSLTSEQRQQLKNSLTSMYSKLNTNIDAFENLEISGQNGKLWRKFIATKNEWMIVHKRVVGLCQQNKLQEATALSMGEGLALHEQLDADADTLTSAVEKQSHNALLDMEAVYASMHLFVIILTTLGCLLAAILGWIITKSITRPLQNLTEASARLAEGDATTKVTVEGSDEVALLATSVKAALANIRSQTDVAQQIAKGDLSVQVSAASDRDTLAQSMQAMVDTLRGLVQESTTLTSAAAVGQVRVRGNYQAFQGAYRDIVVGVNNTLDAIIDAFDAVIAVSASLSQKDLTARMSLNYQGEFLELAQALNKAMTALESAFGQTDQAAERVLRATKMVAATSGEVGRASSAIAQTISQVAQGSSEQSRTITSASASMEQLSRAIEDVARGAQSQANIVQDTVVIVQQISDDINTVAATAQQATAASMQVSDVAQIGGASVKQTVEGMLHISETSGRMAEAIKQLGAQSRQIGMIVEAIDDIADQTNLLALNATIEAARAGEHGKGFAVVADEIRKLAERSSNATREIAELIRGIQQGTDNAVSAMNENGKDVQTGVELARKAGESLSDIQAAVNSIVGQIREMATSAHKMNVSSNDVVRAVESLSAVSEESSAATEEMAAVSTEVNRSIEQVVTVSEQNAAAAEEVSAAAEEQSAAAQEMVAGAEDATQIVEKLQQMIGDFKITKTGQSSK